MSVSVTLDEMETTISLFPSQVQNYAEVYSCIPGMVKKLRKLAAANPDDVKVEKEDDVGIFVQVPAKWIQIRKPKQMNYSDEQRVEAAARLAAAREKKKKGGEKR